MNSIAFNEAYSQCFELFGHLKYNFESEGNQKIVTVVKLLKITFSAFHRVPPALQAPLVTGV